MGGVFITGLNWLRDKLFSPNNYSTATVITVYKSPQSTNKKITLAKVETNSGSQTVYSGCRRVGSAVKNFANEAKYDVPVYGYCLKSTEALYNGDYPGFIGNCGLGIIDMCLFGSLTEARTYMNAVAAAKRIATAQRGIKAADIGTFTAEKAVHGNSLKSMRPTWGYKLYSIDGTFLKNGITSEIIPEQRYTQKFMSDKVMKEKYLFQNRLEAWEWEYQQNQILKGPLNKNMH